MQKNNSIATLVYFESDWDSLRWGEGGEAKRKRFACSSIPESLFWLFGGKHLGDLERIVYKWITDGQPPQLNIDGKFLKTNNGWLEDLSIRIDPILNEHDRISVDGEAGNPEREYASDLFAYLRVPQKDV